MRLGSATSPRRRCAFAPLRWNGAAAWAQILLRLKGYAETGVRQPFFDF